MKALSILLIVVGSLIFLVGFPIKISHWPDPIKAFYTGPILFIVGISLLIINLLKKRN
jgi:hypothetical protein